MMLKFKFHCETAAGLNAKDFCYCLAWANASNSYLACQKFRSLIFFISEHKQHIPEGQTCSKTHTSYAACLHEGKELATEVLIFGELNLKKCKVSKIKYNDIKDRVVRVIELVLNFPSSNHEKLQMKLNNYCAAFCLFALKWSFFTAH